MRRSFTLRSIFERSVRTGALETLSKLLDSAVEVCNQELPLISGVSISTPYALHNCKGAPSTRASCR